MEEISNPRIYSLTDTHTHIYYSTEPDKLKQQMQRCLEQGVDRLFLPNVDLESIPMVYQTVAEYPSHCFPMLGLHPCSVKEDYVQVLDQIEQEIQNRKIYAIGEIGIDLYWEQDSLAWQQTAFRKQINWAKDMGLPISIHCREAFDEVFEILKEEQDGRLFGIFHCFTGNLDQAKLAIDLNFMLGIGGVVTFKKAGLDAVVKEIDLKHIVLETDAPYLAPVPFRGKENESSYLVHVAQKVADIHEISLEKLAEITTNNSKKVFNI